MDVVFGQPAVVVMVLINVPQPTGQLGHGEGIVTVTVGVTGHLGFWHGTVISFSSNTMHSGCGPQVVGLKYGQ